MNRPPSKIRRLLNLKVLFTLFCMFLAPQNTFLKYISIQLILGPPLGDIGDANDLMERLMRNRETLIHKKEDQERGVVQTNVDASSPRRGSDVPSAALNPTTLKFLVRSRFE